MLINIISLAVISLIVIIAAFMIHTIIFFDISYRDNFFDELGRTIIAIFIKRNIIIEVRCHMIIYAYYNTTEQFIPEIIYPTLAPISEVCGIIKAKDVSFSNLFKKILELKQESEKRAFEYAKKDFDAQMTLGEIKDVKEADFDNLEKYIVNKRMYIRFIVAD